jgi:glycerophosphoryl diester phosphodiesterase
MEHNLMPSHRSPLVIAHRGASAAARENTLTAFALAADAGADWVELDTHLASDGQVVVFHNDHYDDGRAVHEVASSDRPDDVPLLDEVLNLCSDAGLGVNVEIKALPGEADAATSTALTEAVVAVLADHATKGGQIRDEQLLITSFRPASINQVRVSPQFPTGLLTVAVDEPTQLFSQLSDEGHTAINPWDHVVNAELVSAAHGAGLRVNVWTVNDAARMNELAAWGVDGIITDQPDAARRTLT